METIIRYVLLVLVAYGITFGLNALAPEGKPVEVNDLIGYMALWIACSLEARRG